MKLLIAIPAMDFICTEFVKSLLSLIERLRNDGIDFEVRIEAGTLVYMARDKLARYAIACGFTHVLWLDSDMVFNDDLLEDLQFSGEDFVSGIAHNRRKPYVSCLFKSIYPTVDRYVYEEYPSNTFEVAGCGMAVALITTKILNDIFDEYSTCFTPTPQLGEDLAFCKRVHDKGYHIYAEPGVKVGHVGHITIYPEDSVKAWEEIR